MTALPLKAPIGSLSDSGRTSIRRPDGGRLLTTVKAMPRSDSSRAVRKVASVSCLSGVISVPSTSEMTSEIAAMAELRREGDLGRLACDNAAWVEIAPRMVRGAWDSCVPALCLATMPGSARCYLPASDVRQSLARRGEESATALAVSLRHCRHHDSRGHDSEGCH